MGIGAVAIAGFGLAVKAAADFGEQMSGFQAVTNVPADQLELIRQKALQLGRDSAFGAGEVMSAFTSLAKAGVSATEIAKGVGDASVTLAAASKETVTQAGENLVNVMRTFNLGADQATHVADVLSGTVNSSTLNLDDLSVSLKYAGAVASALGIPVDQVAQALGILANNGIKGSTGGTALRKILLDLAPTSKKAAEMLQTLGIETKDGGNLFFDAAGKAKSLSDIAQILQDHTKGLSDQQKQMALNVIFGNRAVAAANILAANGAAGFSKMADQIGRTTSLSIMNTQLDNVNGRLKIFKSSIETAFIATGAPAQNVLKGILEKLTGWVNAFAALSPHTQEFILKMLLLVGGLALFAGGLIKVVSGVTKMIKTMKEIAGMVKFFAEQLGAAMDLLMANPIILIIAAIALLAIGLYELYQHSKGFKEFIDALWQGIQTAFHAIIDFFTGLPKWFSDRWDEVKGAFKAAMDWIKKNWDILLTIFTGPIGAVILIWRRFGDDIENALSSAWDTVTHGVKAGFDSVIDFFKKLPGRIMGFLDDVGKTVQTEIEKLPNRIAYAAGFILGALLKPWVDAGKWVGENVPKMWDAILSFFEGLPGRIVAFFDSIVDRAKLFGVQLAAEILHAIDSVVAFFQALPGRIWAFLGAMWDDEVQGFKTMWHAVQDAVSAGIDATVSFFEALPGKVWAFLNQMWQDVTNMASSTGDNLWQGIQRGVDSAVSFFTGLPKRISDAVVNLALWAYNEFNAVGTNVGNTIKDGIDNAVNWFSGLPGRIWDAIKNLASDVWNWFKGIGGSMWDGFKKALFGSPKTKIEYALLDMLDTTKQVTAEMSDQFDKLNTMSVKNFGQLTLPTAPQGSGGVATPTAVAAQQAVAAGGTNNPSAIAPAPSVINEGDTINITGADTKTALEISREIVVEKKVRL